MQFAFFLLHLINVKGVTGVPVAMVGINRLCSVTFEQLLTF